MPKQMIVSSEDMKNLEERLVAAHQDQDQIERQIEKASERINSR